MAAFADSDRFRNSLLRVSEGLSDDDLLHLINLCRDVIMRSEAESISDGFELFRLLEERGKLSSDYIWYVADLLLVINQNLLLDQLGLGNLSESEHKNRRCQLQTYRFYLTKLAMEVDDKDLQALKSACNCNKEEITHFYQLVIFLENSGKISPKKYKDGVSFLLEAFNKAGLTSEGNGHIPALVNAFEEQLDCEEFRYRMTSKPRGICVIINNVNFKKKEQKRKGSDRDTDRLSRLFEGFLSFKVKVYKDQTSEQIKSVLKQTAKQDHWVYDCFICCVLSHGSLGSVFGVDDVAVKIQDLLDLFSVANCPSLKEKPKVFFFQACQGERYEPGTMRYDFDSTSTKTEADVNIDDTAPSITDLESEYLLGYATTPGYRSFRHTSEGSWYIQELVNSLKAFAASEDILAILTKVNSDVTNKEGIEGWVSVKQMPCPTFTLNKKLYLPPNDNYFI